MEGKRSGKKRKRMMSAREVQEEYLNMDIRTIRKFLNQCCSYKKIGKQYYYLRKEVEALLEDQDHNCEFTLDE